MSLDCPWLYRRIGAAGAWEDLHAVGKLVEVLDKEPELPPLVQKLSDDESESELDVDEVETLP